MAGCEQPINNGRTNDTRTKNVSNTVFIRLITFLYGEVLHIDVSNEGAGP
jgi:hypothetical protein